MPNGKAKAARTAQHAAASARKAARKVQALAHGQARPFKARTKQFRRVAKHMGGGPMSVPRSIRKAPISFSQSYFNASAGRKTSSTLLRNDTAISTTIAGAASTASQADMVWMFNLNPGLPPVAITAGTPNYNSGLSNWSSQQAKLYQKHRLSPRCHVTVKYRHLCSVTQAGLVGISLFKDPKLAIPAAGGLSQQQYIDQRPNAYGACHEDFSLRITGADFKEKDDKQIRIAAPTVTEGSFDLNVYDYGYVVVWVSGVGAGTTLGVIDVDYCWEVNTPSVLLANVSEAPEVSTADHYQNVSVSDTSAVVVPATTSSSIFTVTVPYQKWLGNSSSSVNGVGTGWVKKTSSNLGSALSGGFLTFPEAGLYTVLTQIYDSGIGAAAGPGDIGYTNIRTPSGALVMYNPVVKAVTGGVTIVTSDFEDTLFAPFSGYACGGGNLTVNTYFHNGWLDYTLLDVTDPSTAGFNITNFAGNYATMSTALAGSTTASNWNGDIIVTSMGEGFTKRYRQWKKKREEDKELFHKMDKYMDAYNSRGVGPAVSKVLTAAGIEVSFKKDGDFDKKKDVSPTPSMVDKVLSSLKDDYVMLPLKKDKETDQKRSRSNPPK